LNSKLTVNSEIRFVFHQQRHPSLPKHGLRVHMMNRFLAS
jgi:hypothetical protein